MITMFVKHTVNDYDNWKRVYDSFNSKRKSMGVQGASVHCDPNDSNIITVTHQFADLGTAQAFAGSEDLKSTMANAGVAGRPDIWFTEDIEQTAF